MPTRPPERIAVDGAVIVRHRPHHAEALAAAIGASLAELRPWMPWADDEAATAEFQRTRLTDGEAVWDQGEDCTYLVVDPTETEVLGGTGLHRRQGPGTIEIGYWLRTDQTGKGLMTRVAAALTEAGLALDDVDEVQIRCDVGNFASAAIPRRLGYELREVVDRERLAPADTGRHQVWVTTTSTSG